MYAKGTGIGNHTIKMAAACSAALAMAATTRAAPLISQPTPLVTEHVDLNLHYSGGTWDLRPRDDDNVVEYAAHEALLHADSQSLRSVPASGFEFIGAGAGGNAYVLPQSQNPELLYLGFAGYGAAPALFDRYNPSAESGGRVSGNGRWLKVALDSVKGPGEFSVWQSGDTGPNVFMSTASGGVTSSDALWIVAGGHIHYNFGFTRRGLYQVNLRPSGYLGDGGSNNSTIEGTFSEAAAPISLYFNVDPGYATSGTVTASLLTPRGATAANASGFSEVALVGSPDEGKISATNVDTSSPVFVLLDLADATELGALTVGLSGTAKYDVSDPDNPNYLSQTYFLDDVPATATIDNSLLSMHPGYDLGLRFDALPGSTFDFEFDYSMILDGVGIDRVGVVATAVVPEPAAGLSLLAWGAGYLLRRRRYRARGKSAGPRAASVSGAALVRLAPGGRTVRGHARSWLVSRGSLRPMMITTTKPTFSVLCAAAAAIFASASDACADHTDIVPYFQVGDDGALTLKTGALNLAANPPQQTITTDARVFSGAVGGTPAKGISPGWSYRYPDDGEYPEGTRDVPEANWDLGETGPLTFIPISYNVVVDPRLGRNLSYWNGVGAPTFAPVPGGEVLDIFFNYDADNGLYDLRRLDGGPAGLTGGVAIRRDGSSFDSHVHPEYRLYGDADRTDAPADGFYLFALNVAAHGHASEPFYVLLANGYEHTTYLSDGSEVYSPETSAARAWVQSNLIAIVPEPACPALLGLSAGHLLLRRRRSVRT